MSRIGKMPVILPEKVNVTIDGSNVVVNGPKGELSRTFSPKIEIKQESNKIIVIPLSEERTVSALHGTTRALIQNMVTGVSEGFERIIEVRGVGYRAELNGKDLVLHVGYSHPVTVQPPAGIAFDIDSKVPRGSGADALNSYIHIKGIDKQDVGQIAADVRKVRPPNVYKGKGLRYKGEYVKILPGKAGKTV